MVLEYAFKDVKPLRAVILNVSLFFKILCSKVVVRAELISIHQHLVEALCVFEIYFPPFFVSMIHLVVHLAEEVLLCGPVRFRWMYPVERMMRIYKGYGRNKTYIEGTISEQYDIGEGMRHCMEQFPTVNYKCNKRKRNTSTDEVADSEGPYPSDAVGKPCRLSSILL